MRGFLSCLALICLVLRGPSSAGGEQPSTQPPNGLRDRTPTAHALVNARIVVAPGKIIERGSLIIRDGLIVAVGEKVECPKDCRQWDMTNKTIYAGLFDANSELPAADAPVRGPGYWNSHITPQLRAEEIYHPDEALNAKLRSQGIALRLIAPGRGIIRGTSAVVTTGEKELADSLVKTQVALHMEPTLRPSRERDNYPNSPMGAMALVRQALLDARWYRKAWNTYRSRANVPRPENNAALEVLAGYIDDGMPVVIDAQDELNFLRADRLANEFGLAAVIRGSGQEFRRLDAIRGTGRAIILPVDFPKAPAVATPEAAAAASLEDLLDWDIAPENPGRLEKAGIRIALTSYGLKEPNQFLAAVRRAVERGLSADGALAALTTVPAELFGLSERCGTLEAGKSAHLVVTDGELFAKRTKVVETWVDGQRYEPPSTPLFDLRGTWQLTVTREEGKTQSLELKLGGEAGKLSGTIANPPAESDQARPEKKEENAAAEEPKDKPDAAQKETEKSPKDEKPDKEKGQIRLKSPLLHDSIFTASFSGDKLDLTGVVQLSATVLVNPAQPASAEKQVTNSNELQLLGRIVLADGRSLPLVGQRIKPFDPKTEAKRKSADDEDSKEKDETSDDSATVDDEKPVSDAEGNETKTEPAKEVDPKEKADPDQTRDKDADSGNSKKKVKAEALYPVLYPLSAFGVTAPPEQPKHLLFKNATLWTCGPQGVIEAGSLLVSEGKIAAIGKQIDAPAGATVIDLAGAHLSPGIIDCHSHIATDGGVNESGQAITAEVRIGDFVDCNDVNIYRQLAGGVTTINVLHGSANPIGGQNQVIKLRWGAPPEELKFERAPAGIKFALGENVKQANWGDRYTSRYPQSRMGVEQIIRDEFEAARAYRKRQQDWLRSPQGLPPRVDLELEAVAEILEGKRLIHCHSYRQDEILAFMRVCEEFGVRIATLQHILEGYKLADAMARHGAGGSSFSDWWAYKFEVYDAIPYNGALMHNAGVVVSFNSDDAELARRLNLEAAKAEKYGGIKPEEALKFVTLNPASQLGIAQWVGSLEIGKDADLAIWSDSPLSIYARCEQTWVDGRKYFDRQADLARRSQIEKMRADLVQKILLTQADMETPGQERSARRTFWPREDLYCGHHGHSVVDHVEGH